MDRNSIEEFAYENIAKLDGAISAMRGTIKYYKSYCEKLEQENKELKEKLDQKKLIKEMK